MYGRWGDSFNTHESQHACSDFFSIQINLPFSRNAVPRLTNVMPFIFSNIRRNLVDEVVPDRHSKGGISGVDPKPQKLFLFID